MKLHIKKKDNKEKLAKLLASEDITVEYRKVPSASFDVDKRVLTIPILKQEISNDLHDLFIGHEVGHALYTPQNLSETLKKYCNKKDPKFPFSYLNVVEDARIEKNIRNTFPGLRYSFLQGYSELKFNNFFNLDEFGPNSHLMERINIHFKLSSLVDVSFNSEEQVFVDRIAECKTFETVLEICEDLYSFCKSKEEEEDNEEEAFQDDLPEEDGEQVDQSGEHSEEESEKETEGNSEEESEERGEEETEGGNSSEGGEFFDEELETQQGFDNAFDEIISQDARERFYVDIPKVRLDKIIVSPNIILKEMDEFDLYTNQNKLRNLYQEKRVNEITKEYDSFKRKSLPIVNHMVKEFEMRKSANAYKKTRTSKTGVIDTQKLFSYKFSEDIFKQLEVNPDAKNHGLVFFMDWSGSMSFDLEDTFKQLLNLVWFCRKSNIPFKVFAFSDTSCKMNNFIDNISGVQLKYDYKDGDMRLTESLRLLEFFNSDMNNKTFEIMAKRLFIQVHMQRSLYGPSFIELGGTPLNSTIAIAPEIINKFKKDNKVQIVNTIFLTDGVSHSIPTSYYDSERNEFLGGYYREKDMYLKKYNILLSYSAITQTSTLLSVLKLKTNSNVLGFFLTNNNNFIYDLRMSESYNMDCKLKKDFRKNKYLIMKNFKGYNEFYIIKTDKDFRVDGGDEMEIDPTKTATGIKNQFMKYSKGKKEKRIILSKFIEQVA